MKLIRVVREKDFKRLVFEDVLRIECRRCGKINEYKTIIVKDFQHNLTGYTAGDEIECWYCIKKFKWEINREET